MKKIKGLVALALATTITISSNINVFADIDAFVIKDPITNELYQYYEANLLDASKAEPVFNEFLSNSRKNLIYLIHDDSGKYISYQKATDEFLAKKSKGETFDINKYCEKAEDVQTPDYVYNRILKGNRSINELNLIKDNTNKDFKKEKFKNFEDIRLTGNNITISNGEFKGTLTLDPGKNGTAFVNNFKAGDIKILSGNEHSIHFFNVKADTLEVNSNSKVRVEAKGETKIGNTKIKNYAILDSISGTYGEIRIAITENNKAEKEQSIELRGIFTEPIIIESSVNLKVHENAIVPKVEISPKSNNAEIKLYGKFKDVVVKKVVNLNLGENTTVDNLKSDVHIDIKVDKTSSILKLDVPKNTKPVELPTKSVESPTKSVEPPTKQVEPPIKQVEPPTKPVEPPIKPVEPPSKPSNEKNELAVVDVEKSKIMDIEYVYYGIIVLKEGIVNDYEFFIDDKKVDVEKVNTKGTILKFELKDAKDKKITVKKDNKKQEILLKVGNSSNSSTNSNVNQVKLAYSSNRFVENDENDGGIKNVIDVTLEGTDNDVEFVDGLSSASFSKMPKGLMLKEEKISSKKLRFYVEGKAEKHNNADDSVLRMEFTKGVFKNLKDNAKFVDLVKEINLDFRDSGENNGQTQSEGKIIDSSKTKIMEIESVIYAVITLKEGTVDSYEFFIDGKKTSLEKVNLQGTILKIELSDLKDKELIVKKGNVEEKLKLKSIR